MRVSVISRWHNEAFLAPFFLSHYSWADEIIIMLDSTSNDRSAEIIESFPNAQFKYFESGGVLNDRLLAEMMSSLAGSLKSDWVIYVDADELAFPERGADPRETLAKADGNVIETWFRWVYRHKTDLDLDPSFPAVPQRRHGGRYTLAAGCWGSFMKPCIVKPETGIRWGVGTHGYAPSPVIQISHTKFDGVHWQMADVEMAVKRSLPRTNATRLSSENLKNGWGVRNWTEESIRAECKAHENDPLVI
jgi:glycosyltransferase involved in cell wall biosynthesis